MKHFFASNDDPAPMTVFKLSIGWLGVGLGYFFEHVTQFAALAAFIWSCLNIYFLLSEKLKGKKRVK